MEGQGKRLLLAVVLALGVFMLWQVIFPPEKKPPAPTDGSGAAPAAVVVAKSGVERCQVEAPAVTDAKRLPPELTTLTFPGFQATFSTYGGSLVSWKLTDPRFQKDATKGELLPAQPDAGAFQIGFWQGSSKCLPAQTDWKLVSKSDTQVVYSLTHDGLTFEKTFTIVPETYMVKMAVKTTADLAGKNEINQQLAVTSYAFQDPKTASEGGMQVAARVWNSSTLTDGEILHTPLKELKDGEQGPPSPRYEANITWTGFEHPYLLSAYAPKKPAATDQIAKHTYPLEPYGLMRTDIKFPAMRFTPTAREWTHEVVAFLGPKTYKLLEAADAEAEKAGVVSDFKETIDLGWFAFIGRPLMWLLLKFHSIFGSWALAIVLLTILVKGATLYWTTKSMRSMKQMAALAPQMKALQEKYKNDRQRIQVETMALYKQHNVNPLAGCLPILLQMPIWLALYRMLSSAGELYQEAFIPGWIDDLTNTDPYHILPIILVITMFLQARMTPQTGDSRQQKFLVYGMPLMFGVMSFFFPAGLTLYIFTNTLLSALHSLYMNKYDKKSLEIAAQLKKNAEAAKAAAEGKPTDKATAKKPVVDATSVEKTDESEDRAEATSPTSPARPRPKQNGNKKKRRR